jgi:hypothetical protein
VEKPRKKGEPCGFVVVYRHYRTGKLMDARKYGYKAWPIPIRKKRS